VMHLSWGGPLQRKQRPRASPTADGQPADACHLMGSRLDHGPAVCAAPEWMLWVTEDRRRVPAASAESLSSARLVDLLQGRSGYVRVAWKALCAFRCRGDDRAVAVPFPAQARRWPGGNSSAGWRPSAGVTTRSAAVSTKRLATAAAGSERGMALGHIGLSRADFRDGGYPVRSGARARIGCAPSRATSDRGRGRARGRLLRGGEALPLGLVLAMARAGLWPAGIHGGLACPMESRAKPISRSR
jgi:hypothetical protein